MFHLEDCYNLRSGANVYNQRALDLYVSNFAFFVAKCQDCVELSITEQFNQDENLAAFPFCKPDDLH